MNFMLLYFLQNSNQVFQVAAKVFLLLVYSDYE